MATIQSTSFAAPSSVGDLGIGQQPDATAAVQFNNQIASTVGVRSSVPVPVSDVKYWGIGFMLDDLAGGAENVTQLIASRIPGIGPQKAAEFKLFVDKIYQKVSSLSAKAGIPNAGKLFKVEFDFPISGSVDDWKSDTVVHLKLNINAFKSLPPDKGLKILHELMPNITAAELKTFFNAVRAAPTDPKPISGGSLTPYAADVRVTLTAGELLNGNFNPATWSPRYGVFVVSELGNTGTTLPGGFNNEVLGFFSARVWADGTAQVLIGVADDTSTKATGGAFFEVGRALNIKFKDLVKVNNDTFGVRTDLGGKVSIIELPKAVSDQLPQAMRDAAGPTNGDPQLTAAQAAQKAADIKLDPTLLNGIKKVFTGVAQVTSFANDNPTVRDGLTLLAGLAGFLEGPATGAVTTIGAVQQINQARKDDFYNALLKDGLQDPAKISSFTQAVIKTYVDEANRNVNGPLGPFAGGGNAGPALELSNFLGKFQEALSRMDQEGKLKGGSIALYQELQKVANKGDDDPLASTAANILLGNPDRILFAGGVSAPFKLKPIDSIQILKEADAGKPGQPANIKARDVLEKINDYQTASYVAGKLLDQGTDAFSLVRAAYDATDGNWKGTPQEMGLMFGDPRTEIATNVLQKLFYVGDSNGKRQNVIASYVSGLGGLDKSISSGLYHDLLKRNGNNEAGASAKLHKNINEAAQYLLDNGLSTLDFGSASLRNAIDSLKPKGFIEGVKKDGATIDKDTYKRIQDAFSDTSKTRTLLTASTLDANVFSGVGAPLGVGYSAIDPNHAI